MQLYTKSYGKAIRLKKSFFLLALWQLGAMLQHIHCAVTLVKSSCWLKTVSVAYEAAHKWQKYSKILEREIGNTHEITTLPGSRIVLTKNGFGLV